MKRKVRVRQDMRAAEAQGLQGCLWHCGDGKAKCVAGRKRKAGRVREGYGK